MNEIGNPDLPSVSENKVFEGDDNRIRLAWKDENVILMPGDSIVVRERTNTVNILGEFIILACKNFKKIVLEILFEFSRRYHREG